MSFSSLFVFRALFSVCLLFFFILFSLLLSSSLFPHWGGGGVYTLLMARYTDSSSMLNVSQIGLIGSNWLLSEHSSLPRWLVWCRLMSVKPHQHFLHVHPQGSRMLKGIISRDCSLLFEKIFSAPCRCACTVLHCLTMYYTNKLFTSLPKSNACFEDYVQWF